MDKTGKHSDRERGTQDRRDSRDTRYRRDGSIDGERDSRNNRNRRDGSIDRERDSRDNRNGLDDSIDRERDSRDIRNRHDGSIERERGSRDNRNRRDGGKDRERDSRDNRNRRDGSIERERDCMRRNSDRRDRYASNSHANSSSSDSEDDDLRGSRDRKDKRRPEYDRQHSRNSQDGTDERYRQSRDTSYSPDRNRRRLSSDRDCSRGGREPIEERYSSERDRRNESGNTIYTRNSDRDCSYTDRHDEKRRERKNSNPDRDKYNNDNIDRIPKDKYRKEKRNPSNRDTYTGQEREKITEGNSKENEREKDPKDRNEDRKKPNDRPPSRGSRGGRPASSNQRGSGRGGQNVGNRNDIPDPDQNRSTGAVPQQQQSQNTMPLLQQQQVPYNMPPPQQQQLPYNMPPPQHQQPPYTSHPAQQQQFQYNLPLPQQQQYQYNMHPAQQPQFPYNMPTLQQQPSLVVFANGQPPRQVFANDPPPHQHMTQFVGNAMYPVQPLHSPPSLLNIPTTPFTGGGQMYRSPSQVDVSKDENESRKGNARNAKEKRAKRKPNSGGGKDTKTNDDGKNQGGTNDMQNPSGFGQMYRTPSRVDVSKDENRSRDNHNTRNPANKINKSQQNPRTDRGKHTKTNDDVNYRNGTKEMTSADTQAVSDEEAKLITDVFDYMVKHFNGSGSPENISRESGLFPTDFNVIDWFKDKREFAALVKDGNVITVNVCKKSIQYCFNYITKSGCSDDSKCKHFHLCKDFIMGYCCFEKKCNLSHNAKDGRNIIAARRYGLDNFSNEKIIRVLALRYPHVCQEWAKTGSCPNNMCFNLHICPRYINRQCKDQNCPKGHDRTSLHNDPIVSAYEMKTWTESLFQKAVYLIREKENKEDMSENDHDATAMEPNKEAQLTQDVFQFIVKTFDGSGSPDDIRRESGLFPTDFDVSDWFKKKKQKKHFAAFQKDDKVISVTVCRKDISYCFNYITRTGCTDENCRRFHVCKDFLCGYCFFGEKCHSKHNVTDKQNKMAARNYRLDNFTNDEIICILKRRYPHVCKEWANTGKCSASICNDLHVCPGYIKGKCQEENCPKIHDRKSPHNGPIVNAYGLDYKEDNRGVYLVREREVAAVVEENPDLLNKDIAGQKSICTAFLVGDCKKRGCKQIHSDRPYIWQVKLWDEWRAVAHQETVEELFSRPDKTATNQIAYNELTGDGRSATFNIMFEPLRATCIDPTGQTTTYEVRRLSTKSFAFGKANGSEPFRTEWRWYLEQTPGEWLLMEPDSFQLTVETKYLDRQDSYLYTRENFKLKYQLNLDRMEQIDLATQVSRNIRRRPLFVSANDVKQQISPGKLLATPLVQVGPPPGWVPWDHFQPFEWVKLSSVDDDYKQVSGNFYKTLDPNKQIIDDIYRVQNHVLWSTFSNHLERVMKPKKIRLGDPSGTVTTLDLYHGTDNMEAVQGISINNFDSRTSGKNMTRFGDGAYFATDAKYSHEYTKGPHRLMFQARVLVGEATEGKPEYRRPPDRPGMDHELYDSCVDVLKDPRIYVLFKEAQCYPEFLIHYHSVGDLKNTPAQDATELTSCCLL